jgi:ubiquinone/menaquinone biosynthesis C-methylase UbiE/CheY-like chemotaxis protein
VNDIRRPDTYKPVVLIVNSNQTKVDKLKDCLKKDYALSVASTGQEAVQLIKSLDKIDALILDLSMSKVDGGVFIRYINEAVAKPEEIIKMLIGESQDKEVSYVGAYGGGIDYFYNHAFDPLEVKHKLRYLLAQKSKEKRGAMRISLGENQMIVAESMLPGVLPVENISEGGMFVGAVLPESRVLPFKLVLPDGQSIEISGYVVRIDKESGGAGVRFLNLNEAAKSVLVGFLTESVTFVDLSELKDKYPFLRVENIVSFSDEDRIAWLFQKARESGLEITVIPSKSRLPVTLKMGQPESGQFCRLLGENLNMKFKTSNTIFVSFQVDGDTFNFETAIYSISEEGREMQVLYPRLLFYSDKRSLQRARSAEDLRLEISLPSPYNKVVQGQVTDISEGGVSFITDPENIALLIGTPLNKIKIFKDDKLIREVTGEVRNILEIKDNNKGQVRYGLQFGIGRLSIQTSYLPEMEEQKRRSKVPDTDRLRMGPRRQSDLEELAKRPPEVIHLENNAGEEIIGLLDVSFPLEDEPVPVVIIPPAFGKTKETLFALAETLVENFYLLGKSIVVLRFDGIRRKGESYKDPEASIPPYEMVNASLSQGAQDIEAVIDWLDDNPILRAGPKILVTFSLAALEARLALRDIKNRRRIAYWISCMGTPELRHLLTRVNCGLDLLEQYQLGIELGVRPVLGNLVNVDKYMHDGVINRISSLDEAREDMKIIDIPITWIYGQHDHWVKTEFIRDVMGIKVDELREVIPIPLGHNARTSKDALLMFGAITSLVNRFLHQKTIKTVIPKKVNMGYKMRLEKDRIPKRNLKNRDEYWRRYLVGESDLLGFDVLSLADDYKQLMEDQYQALELKGEDNLLDLGGGTGNFVSYLLNEGHPLPMDITISDLVPEALKQAGDKLKPEFRRTGWSGQYRSICLDVEMNRYLPVLRYIRGEFAGFKMLVDRIENLSVQSAAAIEKMYYPRLHRILRGVFLTPGLKVLLKNTFQLPELRVISDFNKAARYVRGLDRKNPSFQHLAFSRNKNHNLALPFQPGYYDKILMSLVLSYIFNPLETLIEVRRILKPEGYLVISSLFPDADASGLFTRLVEKVEEMPPESFYEGWDKELVLSSIRSFLNDAQALVELGEAGTFDFFDKENLISLLEEAGFDLHRTIDTFGDPPQGYICVAKNGKRHE